MATAQLGTLLRHIHKLAAGRCWPQRTDRQLLDDFAARRDEAAFAALVARHGPMVLRVCRRVLNHEQDAEDAFQATFLVLARRTGSIRKREALANWLYGVAYRTAMKAKRSAARRRNHEARLRERRTPVVARSGDRATTGGPTWDEVQAVLDEEIQRLPDAYRAAFVLCLLEGKSGPQAAAELKIKAGTVWSRLTRARQLLQRRLTRRGLKLAAVLAALSVADSAGKAALPAMLAHATVRNGLLVAAGETAAGQIPSHVAALAAGVTRAMFVTKAKIATAVVLTATLVMAAGALTHQALNAQPAETAANEAPTPRKPVQAEANKTPKLPAIDASTETFTYSGRVLDPDGKPVAGAKVYMTPSQSSSHYPSPWPEYAKTGPDGRFAFTVPKVRFGDQPTVVTATAANHGPGWVEVAEGGKRDDLTLRLVKDDVPITGQIVDLEGKPVPGATLRVLQINAAAGDDVGPWLAAAKAKKGSTLQLEQQYFKRFTIALSPQVTTGTDGRFRLTGIGRNRLVRARLDGPTIASQYLNVLTRRGETIEVLEDKGNPEYGEPRRVTTYYVAGFRHVAAPTRPIVGVVRDKDTRRPLAGVTVRGHARLIKPGFLDSRDLDIVRTTTDAQGRYQLVGMPKGEGYKILAIPDSDQPYVVTSADVPDSPGLGPVMVDFALKRGVWIEGKVTDKVTGKPVRGDVEYFSLYSNPNLLSDYPGFIATIMFNTVGTKEDGSYRVVGLPGPGLVGVLYHLGTYLRAPERQDEYGTKEPSLNTAPWAIIHPSNYNALAPVNPAKGAESVRRDVTLDPGWALRVTVLGPGGKPLPGVQVLNLNSSSLRWRREGMKTTAFTGWFNPHGPREFLLRHAEKGLVGVAQPRKENGASVTVRMERGAAVTGRLVDARGQPRAGVELKAQFQPKGWESWFDYLPERIQTDSEGRFRIKAILPAYEFKLSDDTGELPIGDGLRSGETKDLGDVQLKRGGER